MSGPAISDERADLIQIIQSRLDHLRESGGEVLSDEIVASLIADDIRKSDFLVGVKTVMFGRGIEAGMQRALRVDLESEESWTDETTKV